MQSHISMRSHGPHWGLTKRSWRLWRRAWDRIYSHLDRRFDRLEESLGGRTVDIRRMRQMIDDLVIDRADVGVFAPHVLTLKVPYSLYLETSPTELTKLQDTIHAYALDHINDHLLRTFGPVQVKSVPDIYSRAITVDLTFGQFEQEIQRERANNNYASRFRRVRANAEPDLVRFIAHISWPGLTSKADLSLEPGGPSLNVGRSDNNDLSLNHPSVSSSHAALALTADGILLVADTGSTNGTSVNGRRIPYRQTRQVGGRDIVSFGKVKVRVRKLMNIA